MKAVFHTIDSLVISRDGQEVEVVRLITEEDWRHDPEVRQHFDSEVLPMYRVRFQDGSVLNVFPDELGLDGKTRPEVA